MTSKLVVSVWIGASVLACASATPPARTPGAQTPGAEAPVASAEPAAGSELGADDAAVRDALKKGEGALEAGRLPEAKKVFEGVLASHAGHPKATFYLGVLAEKQGDKAEAEKRYRAALERAPQLAEAAVNLAAMLVEAGRNDEAVKVLEPAVEKNPADPLLHTNLAFALAATGNKEGAVVHYRAALKAADNPETRFALAVALVEAKKKDEAVGELKKVLSAGQANRALVASVARYLGKAGAYADCVAAFDKAIGMQAAAELHVGRGICRHELKDEAGAKDDFDKAVAVDPKYAPAYYYLGEHYLVAKKSVEAQKAFEKCVALAGGGAIGKRAAERLAGMKKK
jgi:Flp pilus assembly protein TadD